MKAILFINTAAHQGRARKKWNRIKHEISDRLPDSHWEEYTPPFDYQEKLQEWLEEGGIDTLLYAGGDGTMNHLLNTLMKIDYRLWKDCFFGGIGLGSSNDFQKPYQTFIQGIPVRLNPSNAKYSDVGWVELESSEGKREKKYFLINASLGVTAAANLLFNRGDPVIRLLKPLSSNLSIIYTAIKTILTFKNRPVNIRWAEQDRQILLSNMAILKMPNISGSFKFSQAVLPDDGRLGVNLCINMSRTELLKVLYHLSIGQFQTSGKKWSFFTKKINLLAQGDIPMETDGDVYLGQSFEFGLLPQKIKLLGS
jgi:diacylglycerol kinase family enzyme